MTYKPLIHKMFMPFVDGNPVTLPGQHFPIEAASRFSNRKPPDLSRPEIGWRGRIRRRFDLDDVKTRVLAGNGE